MLFICLLAGCGFHLRGSLPLTTELKVLAINSANPYGTLTLQLKQILQSMGAQIVPEESHPALTLFIDNESFTETSITQSASFSVQQYMMVFTVTYHLTDKKGNAIYSPKPVIVKQLYSVNQNQVLSTDAQLQTLQQEMQQTAVYQILSQLNSVEAKTALAKITSPSKPQK
jgi:LPS-assembly lipoprotein